MSAGNDDSELINTLENALLQSKNQVKTLQKQSILIAQLENENQRLKDELATERRKANVQPDESEKSSTGALFLQNAKQQHEIDRLKSKLKHLKSMIQQHGLEGLSSSSPVPTATPTFLAKARLQDILKSDGREPLARTACSEVQQSSKPIPPIGTDSEYGVDGLDSTTKKRKLRDVENHSILGVAEDGEQVDERDDIPRSRSIQNSKHNHAKQRLNNLLAGPAASPSPLQTRLDMSKPMRPNPTRLNAISHGRHHLDSTNAKALSETFDRAEANAKKIPTHPSNARLRFVQNDSPTGSSMKQGPGKKSVPTSTEVFSDGHVRQGHRSTIRPPLLPPRLRHLSDNEILRQYLGSDSEKLIQNLTNSARENLLHEAKTKMIADDYDHRHGNIPPPRRSPKGFWSTDWISTQDGEDQGSGEPVELNTSILP